MTVDIKNQVMALAAPLSPEELDGVVWLARSRRAALLKLPQPKKPGAWEWVRRAFFAWWQHRSDLKAFSAEISRQAERICELEDFIESGNLKVPGGRSDE